MDTLFALRSGMALLLLLIIFVGLLVLFLIIREIVLWHWRINHFYDLFKNIDSRLADIADSFRHSVREPSQMSQSKLPKSSQIDNPELREVMEQLEKEQPKE